MFFIFVPSSSSCFRGVPFSQVPFEPPSDVLMCARLLKRLEPCSRPAPCLFKPPSASGDGPPAAFWLCSTEAVTHLLLSFINLHEYYSFLSLSRGASRRCGRLPSVLPVNGRKDEGAPPPPIIIVQFVIITVLFIEDEKPSG